MIVVVVEEEYGEYTLAAVVSGLVLGCLLALPDNPSICRCPKWRCADITCQVAGEGQTMALSQHGVGGGKKESDEAVKQNSATGNRTLPTAMSVRNPGQSPRVLGLQAIVDRGRNCLPSRRGKRESLPSPLTVTGQGTSANGHGVNGKPKAVPSQPTAVDLEIGGAYTVPRKKRAGDVQGASAAVGFTGLLLLAPSVGWARRPLYKKTNAKY